MADSSLTSGAQAAWVGPEGHHGLFVYQSLYASKYVLIVINPQAQCRK